MKRQLDLVLEKEWDILLVLDACRYDFFKKVYRDYLEGELQPVWSAGSCTHEWCLNAFDGHKSAWKDVEVISANPHINSISELPHTQFNPLDIPFQKVYDVWTEEYAHRSGSVHPKQVVKKFNHVYEGEKTIIWFIQPHTPYLTLDFTFGGINPNRLGKRSTKSKRRIRKVFEAFESRILPIPLAKALWKLWDQIFGLVGIRRVMANLGETKLLQAYEDNLRIALQQITKMNIDMEDKKVIVTADHGDILKWREERKYGKFAHPPHRDFDVLRKVPWFELKGVKS